MLKIRRPLGRLIFSMGIAIPGKTVFLIETAPCCLFDSLATQLVANGLLYEQSQHACKFPHNCTPTISINHIRTKPKARCRADEHGCGNITQSIMKYIVCTITHCLGLGHKTMVSAVCLSIFLWSWHQQLSVLPWTVGALTQTYHQNCNIFFSVGFNKSNVWNLNISEFIPACYRLNDFVLGFRLSGEMRTREFPNEERCHNHTGYPGCSETLNILYQACFTKMARYVYVLLPGNERTLTICELEVYVEGKFLHCIS